MKWIIITLSLFVVIDVLLLQSSINKGMDVFMPWFYIIALVILYVHTLISAIIISRNELFDKKPFLSNILLSPCYLFVGLNTLGICVRLITWAFGYK